MVLVDRNAENIRNGRRSRGSSPNGAHGLSPEDSSDDDNSTKKNGTKSSSKGKNEFEEKIRVGKDYQVVCPDLIPIAERKPEQLNDRALLVWSPTKDIPESKLEEYITVAKEKYGYNGEQALGMLFWHKHDLERAVLDLANFTPFPDEWTVEDKVLFEQAFQFHGKSFHRIRQMLPDKSIASLVKYYYSWKKTRSRASVMDRQEKKKNDGGSSENGSENGSNEDSDNEEKKWPNHRGIRRSSRSPTNRASLSHLSSNNNTNNNKNASNFQSQNLNENYGTTSNTKNLPTLNQNAPMNKQTKTEDTNLNKDAGYSSSSSSTSGKQNAGTSNASLNCTNCGVLCNELKRTVSGSFCYSCYHHWRRTGSLRPTSGPSLAGTRSGKRSHPKTGQLYFYHGYHDNNKHKRMPPKGMYINHDDVVKLATQSKIAPNSNSISLSTGSNISLLTSTQQSNSSENHPDDLLASMDREIVSLLSQIQTNKQKISKEKLENVNFDDDCADLLSYAKNSTSRWTNDETLLVVKCLRKYGKDFQAIAETMITKTEAQVRQFFTNARRRLSLDAIVKEHEAERQKQQQLMNDDKTPSNSSQDPSTSSFLNPQFVIDAKAKKRATENIIMEIDLDEENPMQNGNEQIGNIDEIIGVNSVKNADKKTHDDDDDIQMEVLEVPVQLKSNSSKLLPVKKVHSVPAPAPAPAPIQVEPTTIIDIDDDVQVQNSDEVVKMDTSEKTEESPSVSIIPIPKDTAKTQKPTQEDADKPEVELIDTTEHNLKNSSISSSVISIN